MFNSPSAVSAALASLGEQVGGVRLYPPRSWPQLNCSAAATAVLAVSLAYGAQHCVDMVEAAEKRLNVTFAFVVRARPDLLWDWPLPPPEQWHPGQISSVFGGDERLAIVPRAALRSYFGAWQLLRDDCPLLSHAGRSPELRASLPPFARCWVAGQQLRDCLFRVRPALDGVPMGKTFRSGEHVWAPSIAKPCQSLLAAGSPSFANDSRSGALVEQHEGADATAGPVAATATSANAPLATATPSWPRDNTQAEPWFHQQCI